jgi:site-specific recombinase XerD
MVEAMLFGGLRHCEVLGLRLADANLGERRLFITEGKGGRQRIVPICSRFFATLGAYIDEERPRTSSPSTCSSCSRDPGAAGRCRRMGLTRSWRARALVLACRT